MKKVFLGIILNVTVVFARFMGERTRNNNGLFDINNSKFRIKDKKNMKSLILIPKSFTRSFR